MVDADTAGGLRARDESLILIDAFGSQQGQARCYVWNYGYRFLEVSQIENLKHSAVCRYDHETPISCFSHRRVSANEESNARRTDREQFPKISQNFSTSLALQLLYLGMKIVWVRASNKPSFKTEDAN